MTPERELFEKLKREGECYHEWAKNKQIYWCKPCQKSGGELKYHGSFVLVKLCKCGRKYTYEGTGNDCVKCGAIYRERNYNSNLTSPGWEEFGWMMERVLDILDKIRPDDKLTISKKGRIEFEKIDENYRCIITVDDVSKIHGKEMEGSFGSHATASTIPLALRDTLMDFFGIMERKG